MKIIITGALGHIGSRLMREIPLFWNDAEIVMIDNMLTQRYCSLFNLPTSGKYRFVEKDILEWDVTSVMKGADAVIHLAAITDAASSFKNREKVEKVNYEGTATVANACVRMDVPMIHLSSTSVYGTQQEVVDEDCSEDELQPQSPYAESKLREEKLLIELGKSERFRFVIFRFGTICGVSPGMRFHTAVNKFCWQAVMGQPLTVWKTALHQKRPYLTLDDAMGAFHFAIGKGIFDGRVYNVLTENLTVDAIVQCIKEHVPHLNIEYVDSQIMNQLSYEVSSMRFKGLGFEYTGSVQKSIGETINLLKTANCL